MGIPFYELEVGSVYLTRDNAQGVEAYVVCESKSTKSYLNATPVMNCVNLFSLGDDEDKFNLYTFSIGRNDMFEVEFLSLEYKFDVCVNTGFSFYKEQFIDKFPQYFIQVKDERVRELMCVYRNIQRACSC